MDTICELSKIEPLKTFRFLNGEKIYIRLWESKWRSKRLKYVPLEGGKIQSAPEDRMVIPQKKIFTLSNLPTIKGVL